MDVFIRKDYKLEIEIAKNKTVYCSYKQATFREILDFSKMISKQKSFNKVIINFLNEKGATFNFFTKSVKITEKDLRFLTETSADEILKIILNTYTKGFFDTAKTKETQKGDKKKKRGVPDGAFIAFIMEHTNETFESLLSLTYEAIMALNEGIIWNLRSKTKEGQAENNRQERLENMRDGESIEEALARAKELEHKLKLNKK